MTNQLNLEKGTMQSETIVWIPEDNFNLEKTPDLNEKLTTK